MVNAHNEYEIPGFCTSDIDADKIDADYALSEALGALIREAGCEPLPQEKAAPKGRGTYVTYVRRVNLVTQESWIEQLKQAA